MILPPAQLAAHPSPLFHPVQQYFANAMNGQAPSFSNSFQFPNYPLINIIVPQFYPMTFIAPHIQVVGNFPTLPNPAFQEPPVQQLPFLNPQWDQNQTQALPAAQQVQEIHEDVPAEIDLQTISVQEIYAKFSKLLLTASTLEATGFVFINPNGVPDVVEVFPNEWVHYHVSESKRVCVRCGSQFVKNSPSNGVSCRFHRGGSKEKCDCGEERPCQLFHSHVHNSTSNFTLHMFEATMAPLGVSDPRTFKVYAMDTEMVYTHNGLEVARVTLVDHRGTIIMNRTVQPVGQLVDPNTAFSGIHPHQLTYGIPFRQVRRELLNLINSETILVGHHLSNDLKALKLMHGKIVDTAIIFRNDKGRYPSLKSLARFHLKKKIQEGLDGHDSAQDARICLEIVAKRYAELRKNWRQ